MIFVPLIVAAIWIAIIRGRENETTPPLAPTTTLGRLALGSLGLIVVVALADAAVIVTVPAGVVMIGLASLARWGHLDRGLLVLLPLTFGIFVVLLPLLFE